MGLGLVSPAQGLALPLRSLGDGDSWNNEQGENTLMQPMSCDEKPERGTCRAALWSMRAMLEEGTDSKGARPCAVTVMETCTALLTHIAMIQA